MKMFSCAAHVETYVTRQMSGEKLSSVMPLSADVCPGMLGTAGAE